VPVACVTWMSQVITKYFQSAALSLGKGRHASLPVSVCTMVAATLDLRYRRLRMDELANGKPHLENEVALVPKTHATG